MSDASKAAKRPAEDDRAAAGLEPLGQSLREQISAFEQLGDAPPEHFAKKASKVGLAASFVAASGTLQALRGSLGTAISSRSGFAPSHTTAAAGGFAA